MKKEFLNLGGDLSIQLLLRAGSWYIGDEQTAAQREIRLIRHTTADTSCDDFRYPGTIPT
nr:hypothetical protein [Chlamydia abortus]